MCLSQPGGEFSYHMHYFLLRCTRIMRLHVHSLFKALATVAVTQQQ